MKILCDRTALLEAVSVVSSVVPSKTTKPILQNVLLRAGKEGISLFATDLEMAAKVQLDSVKVSKEGAVLLPGKETAALLRELTDPTVTFQSSDLRCKIESGGGSFVQTALACACVVSLLDWCAVSAWAVACSDF